MNKVLVVVRLRPAVAENRGWFYTHTHSLSRSLFFFVSPFHPKACSFCAVRARKAFRTEDECFRTQLALAVDPSANYPGRPGPLSSAPGVPGRAAARVRVAQSLQRCPHLQRSQLSEVFVSSLSHAALQSIDGTRWGASNGWQLMASASAEQNSSPVQSSLPGSGWQQQQ